MTTADAALLGLIQGLTEYLPVSSSGHLVLAQQYLGLGIPPTTILAFDVLLHQGTLAAVLFFFRRELVPMTRQAVSLALAGPKEWGKSGSRWPLGHFAWMAVIATVPAIIAAVLLGDFFEEVFGSGRYLWIEFAITTAFVLWGQRAARRLAGGKGPGQFGIREAGITGLLQALAILPAVSRSGTTVAGALAMGLERETAARFSFIMSIPALLGAAVFTTGPLMEGFRSGDITITAAASGTVISGIVGFLTLGFLVRIIQGARLYWFAVYTGALSLFLFVRDVLM